MSYKEVRDAADPSAPIFEDIFLCNTTEAARTSEKDLNNRGRVSTGWKELDVANFNSKTPCYLPIHRMADIYADNYKIDIVYSDDVVTIYEEVQAYLRRINAIIHANTSVAVNVPTSDLIKLDRFATHIYTEAGFIISEAIHADNLVGGCEIEELEEFMQGDRINRPGNLPERESFEESFIDNQLGN